MHTHTPFPKHPLSPPHPLKFFVASISHPHISESGGIIETDAAHQSTVNEVSGDRLENSRGQRESDLFNKFISRPASLLPSLKVHFLKRS